MKTNKRYTYPIIAISLMLIILIFNSMFAGATNNYTEQEEIIIEILSEHKPRIDANGNTVVVSVNCSNIYLSEVFRLEANAKINSSLTLKSLEKSLKSGTIGQEEYDQVVRTFKSEDAKNTIEDILILLIEQELFYQEALKKGFNVSFEGAYQYELSLDEEMKASQSDTYQSYYNYTITLAKGFGLTYDEYIKKYIVPTRQKKMSINLLIEDMLKAKGISFDQTDLANEQITILYDALYNQAQIIEHLQIGN